MMDWEPLVISVAPNGARKTHDDHPALPMTISEIVRDAQMCSEAGASVIHLHIRDKNGAHSLDHDTYQETIHAVNEALGDAMLVQITTEAVGRYTPDQQIDLVKSVRPKAASVALKELTADGQEKASAFYHWAYDNDIALQHILYTPGEVEQLSNLIRHGVIPSAELSVLYVLGRYGDGMSQPDDMLPFLNTAKQTLLKPKLWSVCAFGPREGAVGLVAMCLGGHVRVGFENNFYLNSGTLAPNNAALVRQVADGAKQIARPLCQPHQTNSLFGLGMKIGPKTGGK